jgi:hypothetical protein
MQSVASDDRNKTSSLWQPLSRCTETHVSEQRLPSPRVNQFRMQGFCVPRSTTCRALALAGWLSFNQQQRTSAVSASSLALRITRRSTGPIAAYRHLGYKTVAQMPPHRNGPVS